MSLEITNPKTLTTVVIIVLILFAIIYVYMNNYDIGIDNFANYPVLAGDIVQLQGGLASVMDGTTPVPTSIENMIQKAMNNLMPSLSIISYYGTNPPDGWQICDGNELLHSDTKTPVLDVKYNKILTPNLQGRVVIGCSGNNKSPAAIKDINDKNLNTNYYIGNTGGEEKHTLLINEIPNHSHSYYALVNNTGWWENGHKHTGFSPGQWWPLAPNNNNGNSDQTGKTGGNQKTPTDTDSHNNLQPYYVLMYIIKQPLSTNKSITININQALPSV
jgi:microcystin-dependent protein